MKTYLYLAVMTAAGVFLALSSLHAQGSAAAVPSTSSTPATSSTSSIPPGPTAPPSAVTPGDGQLAATPEPAAPAWEDIKGLAYESKAVLFQGLALVERKFDRDIALLNERRATMTNDTDNWDFAMKELTMARSYLRSMATELSKATTKEWNEKKDKITDAVSRVNNALSKVRASTTS